MIAVIGDSVNVASIALREKLEFHRLGLLPSVGLETGWTSIHPCAERRDRSSVAVDYKLKLGLDGSG
jgi:hypothetical protein